MTAAAVGSEAVLPPPRPAGNQDEELCATAAGVLRTSGYRPLGRLRCEVSNGVVTVSGVVPSYHLKQVAQAVLLGLPAFRRVKNLVEVAHVRPPQPPGP